MPQLGLPRSSSQTDVLLELKTFIAGATQATKCIQLELTKSALRLLKTLPAAREAVLEYFCTVFRNAASNYIARIEVTRSFEHFIINLWNPGILESNNCKLD